MSYFNRRFLIIELLEMFQPICKFQIAKLLSWKETTLKNYNFFFIFSRQFTKSYIYSKNSSQLAKTTPTTQSQLLEYRVLQNLQGHTSDFQFFIDKTNFLF